VQSRTPAGNSQPWHRAGEGLYRCRHAQSRVVSNNGVARRQHDRLQLVERSDRAQLLSGRGGGRQSSTAQVNGVDAYWTPAPIVFNNITISTAFDTVLLYNFTQGNRAILVFNFGSTTTTTGGLTLNFPADPLRALIVFA
jgi:hypothetical protein